MMSNLFGEMLRLGFIRTLKLCKILFVETEYFSELVIANRSALLLNQEKAYAWFCLWCIHDWIVDEKLDVMAICSLVNLYFCRIKHRTDTTMWIQIISKRWFMSSNMLFCFLLVGVDLFKQLNLNFKVVGLGCLDPIYVHSTLFGVYIAQIIDAPHVGIVHAL